LDDGAQSILVALLTCRFAVLRRGRPRPVGAEAIGERFEQGDQIIHLGIAQLQRSQQFLAVGMQALLVQFRPVIEDITQGHEAPVVHVGRGDSHVVRNLPQLRGANTTFRVGVALARVVSSLNEPDLGRSVDSIR